jgi:ABC-2 type transport system permease protein
MPEARSIGSSISWARFLAVLLKEFVQMRRDRLTFAMIVGIPILQLALFGYAINTDPKALPTVIVADDASPFTRSLVAALQNTSYFRIVGQFSGEAQADRALQRGDAQFAVIIHRFFSTAAAWRAPGRAGGGGCSRSGRYRQRVGGIGPDRPQALNRDLTGPLTALRAGTAAVRDPRATPLQPGRW